MFYGFGVAVRVGVDVAVGVSVGVSVEVSVGVEVDVRVGVDVFVGDDVGVCVAEGTTGLGVTGVELGGVTGVVAVGLGVRVGTFGTHKVSPTRITSGLARQLAHCNSCTLTPNARLKRYRLSLGRTT